jgi:hypothetical protein
MGTDIHLYVEKKNPSGWWEGVLGPNPQIERELRYASWAREKGDEEKAKGHEKMAAEIASGEYLQKVTRPYEMSWYAPKVFEGWLYDGRNYDLFAILGNVRNGYGFAGVETGSGFKYISDGRGLPDDASDDVREAIDEDSGYMHSVSYVTLRELVDFDWDQVTTHYGVVSEEGYKQWKEEGQPQSYSGGVSGQMVVHVTNDEMEAIINGTYPKEDGKNYYTRVSWTETYKDSVGSFYTDSIPKLKELSDMTDLSDVRIVFGFDS